jgi:hypothetical protein
MVADSGFTAPTGKIVVKGKYRVQELECETTTSMVPGRLAKKGTAQSDVVVCTAAGSPVGWIGYEQAHSRCRPADIDTAYAATAAEPVGPIMVPIINGPGCVIYAIATTSQTIVKGDPLVPAAIGALAKAAALTALIPTGTYYVMATSAAPYSTIAGSLGAEGPIVAYAEENVTTTSSAARIMVRSTI